MRLFFYFWLRSVEIFNYLDITQLIILVLSWNENKNCNDDIKSDLSLTGKPNELNIQSQ